MSIARLFAVPICLSLCTLGCAPKASTASTEAPEAREAAAAGQPVSPSELGEGASADAAGDGEPATEVVDFTGPDEAVSEPAPMVIAPPKRPDMPSMMPGVVTGPNGMAPAG